VISAWRRIELTQTWLSREGFEGPKEGGELRYDVRVPLALIDSTLATFSSFARHVPDLECSVRRRSRWGNNFRT
jgi:hypothetical protein